MFSCFYSSYCFFKYLLCVLGSSHNTAVVHKQSISFSSELLSLKLKLFIGFLMKVHTGILLGASQLCLKSNVCKESVTLKEPSNPGFGLFLTTHCSSLSKLESCLNMVVVFHRNNVNATESLYPLYRCISRIYVPQLIFPTMNQTKNCNSGPLIYKSFTITFDGPIGDKPSGTWSASGQGS